MERHCRWAVKKDDGGQRNGREESLNEKKRRGEKNYIAVLWRKRGLWEGRGGSQRVGVIYGR